MWEEAARSESSTRPLRPSVMRTVLPPVTVLKLKDKGHLKKFPLQQHDSQIQGQSLGWVFRLAGDLGSFLSVTKIRLVSNQH